MEVSRHSAWLTSLFFVMEKTLLFIFIFMLISANTLSAQRIINPVVESKTHPSLTIDSIVLSVESTICYLTVTNLNTEGNAWFCADGNIDLIEVKNITKHRLQSSVGIPVCPDAHHFKGYGEKLSFELHFGQLRDKSAEIDIIENCSDNCFSLKGIVLDQELNGEIRAFEKAVYLYKEKNLEDALSVFEGIKTNSLYRDAKHVAYSYYILPLINRSLGRDAAARDAYRDLEESGINEKKYFIQKLNEENFDWKTP